MTSPQINQQRWSAGADIRPPKRIDQLCALYRRYDALSIDKNATPQQWRELGAEFATLRAETFAQKCAQKAGEK